MITLEADMNHIQRASEFEFRLPNFKSLPETLLIHHFPKEIWTETVPKAAQVREACVAMMRGLP